MSFWKTATSVHRWLGLGLGLWLAVAGLSGSLLVWWHELNPAPVVMAPAGPTLPLAVLVKRAARHLPEGADIFRAHLPEAPHQPLRLEARVPGADGRERVTSLWLDLTSGAVLASQAWGEHWVHWVYDLHDGALLGEGGVLATGLAGLAFLALLLAGGALWTRHHRLPLREALRPVAGLRGLRRWRNLHRAFGLWSLPLLLVASFTGITLSFPDSTRAVLDVALPAAPALPPQQVATLTESPLDQAVALAEASLPGFRVAWVDLPPPRGRHYALALLPHHGGLAAPARAMFDARAGLLEAAPASATETARAWFMALHNGQALGLLHRWLVVVLGLLPAALFWLGLAMRQRRRGRA